MAITNRQSRAPVGSAARSWWRLRWYEFLPEAVLAIGLGLFLVDQTDAATSAFKSGRALGLMAVVAVVWLASRVLVARVVRWRAVGIAIFGIASVGVLTVVVLPAYDDDTVVEAFPTTSPAAAPGTADRPPLSAPAAAPPSAAVEPIRLREGSFRGIDHDASGTVAIYRNPDGKYVVGLEEFDIQPGPDYDVYLVPGSDREQRDGGTRLDDLRGNRGTQFYEVQANLDLEGGEWTVLVWCQTFGVPVANATPA